MTEELMSNLVLSIKGSYKFQYHADGPDQPPVEIDFTPPFRRISMISGLEEILGVKFPTDLNTPEARQFLDDLVRVCIGYLGALVVCVCWLSVCVGCLCV